MPPPRDNTPRDDARRHGRTTVRGAVRERTVPRLGHDVLARRDLVDYALQRRAVLAGIRTGQVSQYDACDAHPHLQLAARHYGRRAGRSCPVCQGPKLVEVHFAYGEELGRSAGQAKALGELVALADRHDQVDVYAVEVCQSCGWNHLLRTFVIGRAGRARAAQG